MNNKSQTETIQPISVVQESVAAYVFWVLFFFTTILLVIFLKGTESFSTGFNRAGIVLQLLAGLSIIPQISSSEGKEKIENFLKWLENFLDKPNWLTRFLFSVITIIATIIAGWFSLLIVNPEVLKPLIYFIFGIITFAEFLFLFSLFFKTKLRTENIAVHLAFLQYLSNLSRLGVERIILKLSLPIFIAGCICQLMSTYIPI